MPLNVAGQSWRRSSMDFNIFASTNAFGVRLTEADGGNQGVCNESELLKIRRLVGPSALKKRMDCDRRVIVNVSGKVFETFEGTIRAHPKSIFNRCELSNHYDPTTGQYFFDRSSKCFQAILTYFQSGILTRPPSVPEKLFVRELLFYGLDGEAIEYCKDIIGLIGCGNRMVEDLSNQTRAHQLWKFLEIPDSSVSAKVYSIVSLLVILLSIANMIVETLPFFHHKSLDHRINTTIILEDPSTISFKVLNWIEMVCVVWFTAEFVLRFASSPCKKDFVRSTLNIIDIFAIMPFYITLIISTTVLNLNKFSILRVLRLVRIFRIFKLSRYSKSLMVLGFTLKRSVKELGLLIFFLFVAVVLFGSAIFYVENGPKSKFLSIPDTFWFCIVTMTTVGYGDMVPDTAAGKLLGAMCAISGLLVIALPIPVIVNNFCRFYDIEFGLISMQDTANSRETAERADKVNLLLCATANSGLRAESNVSGDTEAAQLLEMVESTPPPPRRQMVSARGSIPASNGESTALKASSV